MVGWLLALLKAKAGYKVLMISERSGPISVYLFADGIIKHEVRPYVGFDLSNELLNRYSGIYDWLIVDGVHRNGVFRQHLGWVWSDVPCPVCFISSGKLVLRYQEAPVPTLELPGWTLKEYQAAYMADHDVLASDILEDMKGLLLTQSDQPGVTELPDNVETSSQTLRAFTLKHDLVGGSVRLMFSMTCAAATQHLLAAMSQLNETQLMQVLHGQVRASADEHCDSLVTSFSQFRSGQQQSYDPDSMAVVFLSKFVLRSLLSVCDVRNAKILYQPCRSLNNPALVGWAFGELVHTRMVPGRFQETDDNASAQELSFTCLQSHCGTVDLVQDSQR
eukprot:GILK01008252.1.p1 GENE.GILK01008252.1~~GILK01008252.1.p1  ORF type:complete len:334 (+),score=26.34 GILK01008252.1:470-1471(+)